MEDDEETVGEILEDSTDKSTDKRLANLKPPWKPGESGNPNGRRKGQRDYATLYSDALIKIAEANGIDPDAFETELATTALKKAKRGNYQFYKDLLDRLYGKAPQTIRMQGEVKVALVEFLDGEDKDTVAS